MSALQSAAQAAPTSDRPWATLSAAEKAPALVEELNAASERFTRYSNDPVDGLLSEAAMVIEELAAALRTALSQPIDGDEGSDVASKSLTAHFSPFYLLSNARRICAREHKRNPNWALASELFAVGSTTAHRICREAGIDPDGFDMRKVAPPNAAIAASLGLKGNDDEPR